MSNSSLKFCPVPAEQQPVNEYEQLKNSWFFGWGGLSDSLYWRKLATVWFWGWLIAGPIAAASFSPSKRPLLFILSGASGAALGVLIVVVQLYLAWQYVGDRLQKETISYEESGWYDGQTWTKPTEVLTRDRLIALYQVEPILKRLRKTALSLLSLMGLSLLVWLGLR